MSTPGTQSPLRSSLHAPMLSKEATQTLRGKRLLFSSNPRSRRRNILRSELQRYGVALREDSKICQRFIGGEDISIQYIAHVLTEMDYLSKHTGYSDIMDILVHHHRAHCMPLEDRAAEADVYAKLSVQAKHTALSAMNCNLIEHCKTDFCVANEIGSNQIALPTWHCPS